MILFRSYHAELCSFTEKDTMKLVYVDYKLTAIPSNSRDLCVIIPYI